MNSFAFSLDSGTSGRGAHPRGEAASMDGFSHAIDAVSHPEWDRIISGFDDMNLFQTASFADGLRGERRMSHLLLHRNGDPIAGARVAIMKPPAVPTGSAYVKYAPFGRRTGTPPDEDAYRAVISAVVEEYAVRRGHMVSIVPRPHPDFQAVEERLLREAGFAPRSAASGPITFLVNLGGGEDALRAGLSRGWRKNLKLAEQNRLEIRFDNSPDALDAYSALYDAMVARKRFTDREAIHVLPEIFRRLPPECAWIVTASHGGEAVAAAIVIVAGDVGYYLHGATADAGLALRAGYVLHWRIACWLAEQGVAWYDLGAGFEHPGLRQFKQGLTGRSGVLLVTSGEFDRWAGPQARLVGNALYGARALIETLRYWRCRVLQRAAFRTGRPG